MSKSHSKPNLQPEEEGEMEHKPQFTVVGIGASAGGLVSEEALAQAREGIYPQ